MFTSSPLVGVGPDGFQDAYLQFKPVRSPEDVASAHSMTVDWLASIGVVAIDGTSPPAYLQHLQVISVGRLHAQRPWLSESEARIEALLQACRARRDSVMKNHLVRSWRRVGGRLSNSCARSTNMPPP